MPGLTPRDMNGYNDYDRGPRGGQYGAVNGIDPYRDDYYSHDPYRRDDEDLYRLVNPKNGRLPNERFNTDYMGDQGSLADPRGSEPSFELDHLATFAANTRNGYIHAEDGLRKLRHMENNTGIWTMRCILMIERRYLVVLDNGTGEELERFPIQLVHEPTAIFKNDRREIYNNLILFTILEDAKKRNAQADMHIFQSVSCPAQEIVDEILACKEGRPRLQHGPGPRIPPPPMGPPPEPPRDSPYDFRGMREYIDRPFPASQRPLVTRPLRDREDYDAGQNEILERDVQLLNHCFDDVEKFVARLQQAAEAYKELDKRKRDRGGKNKKKQSGDGMLSFRARPPPASDFVDIFQKFKLSFNLLAKLKAHIHDPNAPELVHFLFTPLSLIYEASRDPVHGGQNLAELAVSPILTFDAKQLLLNCLTSKELEMWHNLGKNWTTSKDEWRGSIPQYLPRFYDGWQPAPSVVEESPRMTTNVALESALLAHQAQIRNRAEEEDARLRAAEDRIRRYDDRRYEDDYRTHYSARPSPRPATPPSLNPQVASFPEYSQQSLTRNYQEEIRKPAPVPVPAPAPMPTSSQPLTRAEENMEYAMELKRSNAIIYEVLHDRQGKNPKELTVYKGDILQVQDSSRNWWKVRNYKGESGFAPYTIMKEVDKNTLGERMDSRDRASGLYSTQIVMNEPPFVPDPPPPPVFEGANRRGRRGDFKYF